MFRIILPQLVIETELRKYILLGDFMPVESPFLNFKSTYLGQILSKQADLLLSGGDLNCVQSNKFHRARCNYIFTVTECFISVLGPR
jgi:hypothetical protein